MKRGIFMHFIEIEKREQKQSYNMSDFQSHDFYEVYFLLSGTREAFIENKLFVLSKNSIFIIPPYHIHKTEGSAYSRINLYFSKQLLTDTEVGILNKLSQNYAYSLTQKQMDFISAILNEGATTNITDNKLRSNYLTSCLKITLAYLSTQTLSPLKNGSSTTNSSYTSDTILRIVGYINENYKTSITLDSLSKQFFISKNTLCKRFKQAMNCSVGEYIVYVRLNKAQMYLSSTAKNMEDIAELCGFPSANYFSLIFKKHFGISPKNYRKKR
jgi:AraC-like DNA-binding protein